MKAFLRRWTRKVLFFDSINRSFEATLGKTTDYLRVQRKAAEAEALRSFLVDLNPERRVLQGPFQGLQYPSLQSFGSALYPKLLGTYENELYPVLEALLTKRFDQIIDIGCAEGYYAVGMALRLKQPSVIAYDLDPGARKFCAAMAQLNDVQDRVAIRDFCSPNELAELCKNKQNLVISDCEGFEEHLFTPEFCLHLSQSDLVIEVHDFMDSAIGEKLRSILAATHSINIIKAKETSEKLRFFTDFTGTCPPLTLQKMLISEGRPSGMYWIVASPIEPVTAS